MQTTAELIASLRIAAADPQSPLYGSDLVPELDDLCTCAEQLQRDVSLYADELDRAAELMTKIHPIGQVKGIGRLEVADAIEGFAKTKYANLLNIANRMLITQFEMYSEKYFAAGWMMDLEHTLWKAAQAKLESAEDIKEQDGDLFDILLISRVLDGWVSVDDAGDTAVVPMPEWLKIHADFLEDENERRILRAANQ